MYNDKRKSRSHMRKVIRSQQAVRLFYFLALIAAGVRPNYLVSPISLCRIVHTLICVHSSGLFDDFWLSPSAIECEDECAGR